MNKFFRISIYLLLGAASWVLIFVKVNEVKDQEDFSYKIKARLLGPCSVPLYYSLGEIDSRFEISKEQLLETIQEAENVWEEKAQKNLFEYKEDSDFKINLVFDERQLSTLERKKLEAKLEVVESSQKSIGTEYDNLIAQYDKKLKDYQAAVDEFNDDLKDYQSDVKYWNKKGGAPEEEYEKLQDEKDGLEDLEAELEKERKKLNALVEEINSLVKKSQQIATDFKKEAQTYKERFGESREFDQGVYTGEAINIYQFSELSDLELVLTHELGHYLGISHLENPESIMYYLMGEQDLEDIQPTQEDLEAVTEVCR